MTPGRRPRLGFAGVGWIGRHRLQALLEDGCVDAAAIADPAPALSEAAGRLAPDARRVGSLDDLLALDLDGVVIATPSALHAGQCLAALARGLPVFCQKPLGRDASEVRRVVKAARTGDLLLGVDLSYRLTAGMQHVRRVLASGELGKVYAIDLVFHNAYGPDKPWFYDRRLSGGGCVIDLGIHLVDLALWALGHARVEAVSSRLFAAGSRLPPGADMVEDYAEARLDLDTGAVARLACSWRLSAGREADIGVSFYGTEGGVVFRNVNGSFYDFVSERLRGTTRQLLTGVPDEWGGRAAVAWARALAGGAGFDPEAESLVEVSTVLDRIYGRGVPLTDGRA